MQEIITRLETEQTDIRDTLKEIQAHLHRIELDVVAVKSRLSVLSAGGVALCGFMVWALQYLLTR